MSCGSDREEMDLSRRRINASREGGRELKRLEMGKEESGTAASLFRLSWDLKVSGRERCGVLSKISSVQG